MVRILFLFLLAFLIPAEAEAQQPARIALLIGNQNYAPIIGPLKNPLSDINLIGEALEKLGFKVTMLADAGKAQMDEAFRRYVDRVRHAGPNAISFFYYSGHGVLNPDTNVNYLVPTDLDDADTDNVWYRSIEQQGLIDLLSQRAPNATHFVVFDACRNELNLSGKAAKGLGAEKGFVPVSDVSGILIAYATAQKKTAADTGIFARILAEELVKPGVEAFSVFREVQVRVEETMHQEPWMSLNYIPRIYLAGAPGVPERASPAPQTPYSEAARAWAEIKDLKDVTVFEAFRKQYGQGNPFYDTLAAQKSAALKQAQPNNDQGGLGASDMTAQGAQQEASKPAALAGVWSGEGTVVYASGQREKARCRATYSGDGSTVTMSSACGTPSGSVLHSGRLRRVGANSYAGSFFNSQNNTPGSIHVALEGNTQSVSIRGSAGSISMTLKR